MANQNFVTRNFTFLVEMSQKQEIAVSGTLVNYLIMMSKDICMEAYTPIAGDNGRPTYLQMRFSTERRDDGFKTHVIHVAVTFKGSFREDVLDIMDLCISGVFAHIDWYLKDHTGWRHAMSKRPMGALRGSWKLSVQNVSDTEGLVLAIANWADPVWQANRASKMLCHLITNAIFARIFKAYPLAWADDELVK